MMNIMAFYNENIVTMVMNSYNKNNNNNDHIFYSNFNEIRFMDICHQTKD